MTAIRTTIAPANAAIATVVIGGATGFTCFVGATETIVGR